MNNLFVLHTQYHLLLSVALIEEQYRNENNYLILFRDFNLKAELIPVLKDCFQSVTLCTGSYHKEDLSWRKKMIRYPALKKQFESDNTIYDNVFLVEDTVIPEQVVMRHSYRKNPRVSYGYIGDGGDAYFTNFSGERNGFSRYNWSMDIRKFIFKYLFGLGKFYNDVCFGANPLLTTCYELYPELVRSELAQKNKYSIRGDSFKKAIGILNHDKERLSIDKNALIIIMDKLSVYEDARLFDCVIDEIVNEATKQGRKIYYKYHPAEMKQYDRAGDWVEIDRNLPAEYVFSCADASSVRIVGIMTTALQTAKKMGFFVTSYIASFKPERQDVIDLYQKIGVEVK